MKRIVLLISLAALLVGVVAHAALAGSKGPTTSKGAVTINVAATEFKFKLSKLSVPKGTIVTFKVTNRGQAPHDFDFSELGKGTAYIAPGKKATYKVKFNKAGRFRFVCTVPRHVELGMSGNFIVK